jgi:hypothetical protein
MPSPWSVFNQGDIPDGVIKINELTEFYDAIHQLR